MQRVKGRFQYAISSEAPKAFRRNFSLSSLGDAKREVVESYVAKQLCHHRMADDRVQERLKDFQLSFPEVDLSQPQFSSHGRYIYNLHLVLVHDDRVADVRQESLALTRDMFVRAAQQKRHRLSRLSLFADHLHATLGSAPSESPQEVALAYMNNLAFAHGMKQIFCFSYYLGTFGDFDMGAVRLQDDRQTRQSTDRQARGDGARSPQS
ncbi:MAG: hypothetical protein HYS13_03705 [Planctomycetia bacterium]|nr:hypothetical protein [Planctomycetia bacterium]